MYIEPLIGYKTLILGWFALLLLIGFIAEIIVKYQEKREKEKSPSDAVTSNEPSKKIAS